MRDVRVLTDEAELAIRLDNCKYPAFGVNGGHSGRAGRVVVNPGAPDERELKTMSDGHSLKRGDRLRIITPGGGGWGAPLDRPAGEVLADVLDGFVSSDSAFADYGVVLDCTGQAVDEAATAQERKARPRSSATSR